MATLPTTLACAGADACRLSAYFYKTNYPPPFPKAAPPARFQRCAWLTVEYVRDELRVPERLCGPPRSTVQAAARIWASIACEPCEFKRPAIVITAGHRPSNHAHATDSAGFVCDGERELVAHWRTMMPMMLVHKSDGLREVARHDVKFVLLRHVVSL
jgi:hypothetical protein